MLKYSFGCARSFHRDFLNTNITNIGLHFLICPMINANIQTFKIIDKWKLFEYQRLIVLLWYYMINQIQFIGSDLIKISVNSYNFIIILFVREHVHTLRTKIFWKKATKHDNRTLRGQKVFFE